MAQIIALRKPLVSVSDHIANMSESLVFIADQPLNDIKSAMLYRKSGDVSAVSAYSVLMDMIVVMDRICSELKEV